MLVTLQKWAAANFDPVPCMSTLRAWANAGITEPPAKKVGNKWMIEESAEYVGYAEIEPEEEMSDRARAILNVA